MARVRFAASAALVPLHDARVGIRGPSPVAPGSEPDRGRGGLAVFAALVSRRS